MLVLFDIAWLFGWEVVILQWVEVGRNESKWVYTIRNGSKLPEMGQEWIGNGFKSGMGPDYQKRIQIFRNGSILAEMDQMGPNT